MGKLFITGKRGAGHVLRLPEGRPDICGRAHETYRRLLVVLANDYSMEIALSRRGGPGEFMRTVGGMPAIAAGWEKSLSPQHGAIGAAPPLTAAPREKP